MMTSKKEDPEITVGEKRKGTIIYYIGMNKRTIRDSSTVLLFLTGIYCVYHERYIEAIIAFHFGTDQFIKDHVLSFNRE